MKVRKAIIPAAGLGTRLLPNTKSIPKEMLPLVIVTVNQMFHLVSSSVLVPLCFCLFLVLFVMYIIMTINQIKEHLPIRAFHVVAKTESSVCSQTAHLR